MAYLFKNVLNNEFYINYTALAIVPFGAFAIDPLPPPWGPGGGGEGDVINDKLLKSTNTTNIIKNKTLKRREISFLAHALAL